LDICPPPKTLNLEISGGHIEKGETSFEAAGRELMEETGR